MKDNSNITQELLETVERYYNNTMSDQERNDFERRLHNEPQFKLLVEDIKTLILGVENQSLKEQLDTFHKDIPETNHKTSSSFFSLRKLAAAAVIVFAISGFWWFSTPQHERLYSSHFTPDPGLPTAMSGDSNFEFYDAMVNYKQGDFETAIEKWDAIHPKGDTLNYFLGVAHLANQDQDQAIPFLKKSIDNPKFPLINDAHLYLGLAYLKEGKIELAKKNLILSNIKKSKDILSELDKD